MTTASLRGRQNQRRGRAGQLVAATLLRHLGLVEVEEIATPTRVIRGKTLYAKKVSGDIYALIPGYGTGVRVEVKKTTGPLRPDGTRGDATLSLADFRKTDRGSGQDHQIRALDRYVAAGGLSLVVWCWDGGAAVLRWPIPGLMNGKPLTIERARALALTPYFWNQVKVTR
jgi:hypothetical protein